MEEFHQDSSTRTAKFQAPNHVPWNCSDEMKNDAGEALHKQSSLYMLSLMYGLSIARTRNMCLKVIAGTEFVPDKASSNDRERTQASGSVG